MPKKKQTGMVGRCGDAASRLADCRWKKERQKKLNKEVDALEAKAKIYELKAKKCHPESHPTMEKSKDDVNGLVHLRILSAQILRGAPRGSEIIESPKRLVVDWKSSRRQRPLSKVMPVVELHDGSLQTMRQNSEHVL